ncbi:hypothetical protein [uncultured Croceicoccus sp.]|uniref:hypothetical protein n=1 Tax=uncultured Croceicoccus sp. TaxID=1295329 RepID=UPI0026309EF4|nr:hypothetical protein [uncultured Croceicoccus sp.]
MAIGAIMDSGLISCGNDAVIGPFCVPKIAADDINFERAARVVHDAFRHGRAGGRAGVTGPDPPPATPFVFPNPADLPAY